MDLVRFLDILKDSLFITFLVFILMVIVEFFDLKFGKFVEENIKKRRNLQYILSSFFGILPGCGGTFFIDTLYIAGIISFGAIVSVMVSTMGDEAFVYISYLISGKVLLKTFIFIMGFLFIAGIFAGYLSDFLVKKFSIKFSEKCLIPHHDEFHGKKFNFSHFFKEHVYGHIFLKHIPKLFLWLFGSLLVVEIFSKNVGFERFIHTNGILLIIGASLIGVIPISGPNLLILTMFTKGLVPPSVLIANSIVQDGHGLLPILSFSVKDAIKIKVINFFLGVFFGVIFYIFGY